MVMIVELLQGGSWVEHVLCHYVAGETMYNNSIH